jgi:hypothetical protein
MYNKVGEHPRVEHSKGPCPGWQWKLGVAPDKVVLAPRSEDGNILDKSHEVGDSTFDLGTERRSLWPDHRE